MVKEAIATGATTEEAYEKACAMLGVDPADAEFEVLETEEKKRFGLFGGRPAKVRAFIRSTPADAAAEYLRNVLSGMGLGDVNIEIREEEAGAELVLTGENIGFIIGHRGETLDSLQYLASLVANHVDESYYRITLDVGNYREKRKETLENLGRKMAARAVKTGRNASLEPMNPYERRIIHTAVQEVEGAKSWSEGEDLARHVVIGPEGGERYVRRNNRGRNGGYNRDNRGARAPRRDNRDSRPAQNRTAPAAPRVLDDVSTPYGKISKN
ncbi:RNA-binding cell elongation regulator Jag/EloR [Hominenteromicrobium sp.]|uniref:RNA-binding cell elongation regulator Jag/EloR n=1 Tax=Hominenteromicrobium sp. TaxID=3073581 RepID=UPI003AB1C60D